MKAAVLLFLVVMVAMCSDANARNYFRRGWKYVRDFGGGSYDMWRAYRDMRESNWKHSDKYFHARGNYRAAKRGTGGRHAARIISDLREGWQSNSGRGHEDSEADQKANRWGRTGGDPNKYRPKGLPKKY